MKSILKAIAAILMLASLSACMVVPIHDRGHYAAPHRYEHRHYDRHDEGRTQRW